MLIANLPNELSIEIPKNLVEKEIRIVDCFHVQSHDYVLGAKSCTFQVIFLKKVNTKIQSGSTLQNSDVETTTYERRRAFMVSLNEQELSTWSNNDETLLETIATKLGVQIESFTYLSNDEII